MDNPLLITRSCYLASNAGDARSVQLLIKNCSGLPAPGSRYVDGVLRNVCPACGEPTILGPYVAGPYWRCGSCSWNSQQGGDKCPCQRISPIRQTTTGQYAVDLADADPMSPRLNSVQRSTITAALAGAVALTDADFVSEVPDA